MGVGGIATFHGGNLDLIINAGCVQDSKMVGKDVDVVLDKPLEETAARVEKLDTEAIVANRKSRDRVERKVKISTGKPINPEKQAKKDEAEAASATLLNQAITACTGKGKEKCEATQRKEGGAKAAPKDVESAAMSEEDVTIIGLPAKGDVKVSRHKEKHMMLLRVYNEYYGNETAFAEHSAKKNGGDACFLPQFSEHVRHAKLVQECVNLWREKKGVDRACLFVRLPYPIGADCGRMTNTVEIYPGEEVHIRPVDESSSSRGSAKIRRQLGENIDLAQVDTEGEPVNNNFVVYVNNRAEDEKAKAVAAKFKKNEASLAKADKAKRVKDAASPKAKIAQVQKIRANKDKMAQAKVDEADKVFKAIAENKDRAKKAREAEKAEKAGAKAKATK